MQKRRSFLPTFSIFFILALLLFFLSHVGILDGFRGFLEGATVPLQKASFGLFGGNDSDLVELRKENAQLSARVVGQMELERENSALRDQFQTSTSSSRDLIPAVVIGITEGGMILDKGSLTGVTKGAAVVYKDNLVGQIVRVSGNTALVRVITARDTSFTAKTLNTGARGVVVGGDSGMILSSVVLTEKLDNGDLVVTAGDVDEEAIGIPPDLVVGKITSVNRRSSDLFQVAEIKSLLDFRSLEMVFVFGGK